MRREILLGRDPAVEVVAELQVAGAVAAVGAVEIEVHVGARDAAAPAPQLLAEGDHAEGARGGGAVLGRGERHAVDVGRRQAAACLRLRRALAQRLAEEKQRRAGAVADGRLGDDDRHRQEALLLQQPLGSVQLAVLRIGELRERVRRQEKENEKPRPHSQSVSITPTPIRFIL
jgi:hypothetical protein